MKLKKMIAMAMAVVTLCTAGETVYAAQGDMVIVQDAVEATEDTDTGNMAANTENMAADMESVKIQNALEEPEEEAICMEEEESVGARAPYGIKNNGTGGIYIDINSSPYTDFANIPTWGQYAYGESGCAWFASARVKQLTGKGNMIYSGQTWWNTAYRTLGFTRGSQIRERSIVCYSGHVAIVEKIVGNTVYISEGGVRGIGSGYGSTWITTKTVSQVCSGALGFVYLPGSTSVSANVSYSELRTEYVDNNNARLYGKINNPNRAVITQVGAYIWNSAGNLVVNHKENCGLSYSIINQNLDVVKEALPGGLRAGESYTYQFFAIAGGKTFYSGKGAFKTTGGDTQKPVISDVEIRNVSWSGYTVVCKVTDNVGVTKVQFPSWSTQKGQDDIIWGNGSANGNTYSYRVNISDHKWNIGNYQTHIYAYDAAGNRSSFGVNTIYVSMTGYRIVPDGVYEIVSALNNNKALDIYGGYTGNNVKTILYDRNGGKNQKFRITYYGNGYYRLTAEHSQKVLDVKGRSKKSKTALQQYTWNKSSAQLFRFVSAGDGYYYMRSKLGTYIDVKGATTANGNTVWMYKGNKGNAQKWKLIRNYD